MNETLSQARADLAAAFRWAARLGYHESVGNHFTYAVNDDGTRFLVNPWGKHFSEIRAGDLLVSDSRGKVHEGEGVVERSAACIHGPIHERIPHARCVLHTHMPYATALTCVEDGKLEMCHQSSARFYGRIAYDDAFNGIALDDDEGDRICNALGNKPIMFMAGHGVLVTGNTIAEAFDTPLLPRALVPASGDGDVHREAAPADVGRGGAPIGRAVARRRMGRRRAALCRPETDPRTRGAGLRTLNR